MNFGDFNVKSLNFLDKNIAGKAQTYFSLLIEAFHRTFKLVVISWTILRNLSIDINICQAIWWVLKYYRRNLVNAAEICLKSITSSIWWAQKGLVSNTWWHKGNSYQTFRYPQKIFTCLFRPLGTRTPRTTLIANVHPSLPSTIPNS